ncbi:hypothetical protein JKF63_02778 [Porcisia hertigi]|uniref:V-SNARE coiled-coil homology domain-containing protein n=1 Tax=Porcisia hertigi TaxID=2761500 RepID=A0A836HEC8_9TRYP|nr:hypothetical protein JKF63_02778 [Porcisia hertigi]
MRMRTVFAFLEAVEPLVRASAGPQGSELRNGKKLLQQKMEFYNNPQNDKITALNDDINQVVDVMMDNMDKVLARGDRIDTLQEKSSTLADQTQQFQLRSTELKRNLCMKNLKLTLMIVGHCGCGYCHHCFDHLEVQEILELRYRMSPTASLVEVIGASPWHCTSALKRSDVTPCSLTALLKCGVCSNRTGRSASVRGGGESLRGNALSVLWDILGGRARARGGPGPMWAIGG